MIANPQPAYISPETYLAEEAQSQIKHEYIDGKMYAMAGATDAHVTITLNVATLLRNHVRGGNYRVFITDMKINLNTTNRFYYPDVMVTCDPRDRMFTLFKRYPCLILEVVSDSTEAFDRGDKFNDYQQLECLHEYMIVSQVRQRVDCFRRNSEGLWLLQAYYPGDLLSFTSIGFRCEVTALYEDVEPPAS
jgi:Uma2 family endonuclease